MKKKKSGNFPENGSGAMKPGFHGGTNGVQGTALRPFRFPTRILRAAIFLPLFPETGIFFLFFFIIFLEYIGKKAIIGTYRGK